MIPAEMIERRILLIRGQKVMLDADRAEVVAISTTLSVKLSSQAPTLP